MNHTRLSKKNKMRILVAELIALAIFVIIVITILVINVNKKKTETSGNAVQTTTVAGTNEESLTNSTVAATSSVTSEQTTHPTEVETAAVDDAEDPQNLVGNDSGVGVVQNASGLANTSTSNSNGIDVSKYQGKIDWDKVKAAGIDFAMIRVGYRADKTGVIYEDPYASYNLQHAQAAGVKIGIYFFSTAISSDEAVAEANWVTSYIAKYSVTYPVVYNCEGFTSASSRMYGISNSDRTSFAMSFLGTVQSNGYTPMLYAAKSELEDSRYWNTSTISSSYKIWVAQYPDVAYPTTTAPAYSGSYVMWQYTSKGVVDGISGSVDMNVAYFSYESNADAKDTNAKVTSADDNPELGVTFVTANEYVTAKEETNLRTKPSTEGTLVATLKYGEVALRTGTGDNGWSRLTYNGQTVYAKTSLITTGAVESTVASEIKSSSGSIYTEVSEQVTAKSETNLRTAATTDGSSVITTLKNGEYVTRTGVGDNGWSRINYNGQTVYAITSYLTN